jgi:hypothetical protein
MIEVLSEEKSNEDGEGPKKSGWKSNRKRGKSSPEKRRETHKPKKEWRFVGVDLSIIMHENPVSPMNHLSRNLSIARFIRVPEIPLTQVNKINDKTESQKKDELSPGLRDHFGKFFIHSAYFIVSVTTPSGET